MAYLLLFFLKRPENVLDLFSASELGRKEVDLPTFVHLPTQSRILEKIAGLCLKLEDEAQLVNPAIRFDGIEKNGVKEGNVLLPRFNVGSKRHRSQRIHDLGDVDVIRASNTTAIAGGTDPDRIRREDLLPMIVLDMAEDLVWKDIHGISHRTSCRTFLTLVTGLKVFSALLENF
jgi:hypothetical protein